MKEILVLSDLHVGSIWGIWPEGFEVEDYKTGNMKRFHPNPTQQKLLSWWNQMLNRLKGRNIECIILNGDLCEGPQRRNLGRQTVTSDLYEQTEACLQLLDTLPKARMYFTQGTEYHTMEDRPLEQIIAKEMGGLYGDDLLIDECGIRIHAQHSVPVSSSTWQYRTTPLARDLLLYALNSSQDKYGTVDVAVRSHAHYFCAAMFSSQLGVITPCWQTRTPYAVKRDIVTPPDIGYVILKVDSRKDVFIDRNGINHIERPCKVVNSGTFGHNRNRRDDQPRNVQGRQNDRNQRRS